MGIVFRSKTVYGRLNLFRQFDIYDFMEKNRDHMIVDTDTPDAHAKEAKPESDGIQIAGEEDREGHWFHSLTAPEKRFHILFYALAGLTGLLVVQLIWQIAVLTAQ